MITDAYTMIFGTQVMAVIESCCWVGGLELHASDAVSVIILESNPDNDSVNRISWVYRIRIL